MTRKSGRAGLFVIRFFDIAFSLAALPFALAAFFLIVIPQLAVFRGVFYVSARTGQHGRPFRHIKLKTMRGERETSGGGRAYMEARRVPPWGRFLRKTHLDEIPEIALILLGKESFVGPRPLLTEHAALVYTQERAGLKPGWTGFSQIFLRRRGVLPSRIQRRLDARLGRELTPRVYLKLLCATAAAQFSRGRRMSIGPTVLAYRAALKGESNENTKTV